MYEYRCDICGHRFIRYDSAPEETECPICSNDILGDLDHPKLESAIRGAIRNLSDEIQDYMHNRIDMVLDEIKDTYEHG